MSFSSNAENAVLRSDRHRFSGRLSDNLTLKEQQYAIKPELVTNEDNMLLSVLGDRMGFGKTFTSLFMMMYMARVKFLMVLCPANLQQNWVGHLQSMLQALSGKKGHLQVACFSKEEHVDNYGRDILSSHRTFAIVVSYNMLRTHSTRINAIVQSHRRRSTLHQTNFCGLIADEAHALRSKEADVHNQVMVLRPLFMHFVAVSGTIFMNSVSDIESIALLVGRGKVGTPLFWKTLNSSKLSSSRRLDLVKTMFDRIMIRRTTVTGGPASFMQWVGVGLTAPQLHLLSRESIDANIIASNRTREAIALAACLTPEGFSLFLPAKGRPLRTSRCIARSKHIRSILASHGLERLYPKFNNDVIVNAETNECRSAPRFADMWSTSGSFRWLMLALVYHLQREEKVLIYCPRIHFLEAVQACAQILFDALYMHDMQAINTGGTPVCFQATDVPAVVSMFTGLGRQTDSEREQNSQDFTNFANVRVLCFSNAGTEGQTWTKASVMITFAGLPWNNGKLHQAQHRHDRIGQVNAVRVVNVFPFFSPGASNLLSVSMKEQAEKIAVGDRADHTGMHSDIIDFVDISGLYDVCPLDPKSQLDQVAKAKVVSLLETMSMCWADIMEKLPDNDKLRVAWFQTDESTRADWVTQLKDTEFMDQLLLLLREQHPQAFCSQLVKCTGVRFNSLDHSIVVRDHNGNELRTQAKNVNAVLMEDEWSGPLDCDALLTHVINTAQGHIMDGVANPPHYQLPMDRETMTSLQSRPRNTMLKAADRSSFGGPFVKSPPSRPRAILYHLTCVYLMLRKWKGEPTSLTRRVSSPFVGEDSTLPTTNVIHNTALQGEVCQRTISKIQRMQHWSSMDEKGNPVEAADIKSAMKQIIVNYVDSQRSTKANTTST